MHKTFFSLVSVTALITATPAMAETYFFHGGGYTDGATIHGWFSASDVNLDGQISSFDGEVTDLVADFSGNSLVGPTHFTFASLTGLVWDQDLFLGDNNDGQMEGLRLQTADAYFAVGPGPLALCNGVTLCATIQTAAATDFSVEKLEVAVPEPASWALMIGGFALAGAALRRRGAPVRVAFAS